MFVDVPGYRSAANRANWGLWTVQCLSFATLVATVFFLDQFHVSVATKCGWSRQPHNLKQYLWYIHHGLLMSSAASLTLYIAVTVISRVCFGKPVEKNDDAVLRIIPGGGNLRGAPCVRAPQGISGLLLQVATGMSGRILGSTVDFTIECQLGAGMYGKVFRVRQTALHPAQQPEKFALKLQKLRGGNIREPGILADLDHPFLVRLIFFFSVSGAQPFVAEDNGPAGVYEFGIMMELCSRGTLQDLLASKWCRHTDAPSRQELRLPGSLQTAHLDDLSLWRRLGAELATVFAFLHGKTPPVAYRDLKPDNVLMRQGRDDELHVCLTDFGLAKRPTFADELMSVAGNGLTAAPEVPRPGMPERPYTFLVDNWSFGTMLLCMLWCTFDEYYDGRSNAQIPFPVVPDRRRWDDGGDLRVPPFAVELINTVTQTDPNLRGTMQGAANARFFKESFTHGDRQFPAIEIQTLLDAAAR